MKQLCWISIRPCVLVFLSLLLLLTTSCGTTSLTATWHDESYGGEKVLGDVLVIGITKDDTIRRLYEDGFVEKLASENIRAIASYTLSQPDIKPDKEAIMAAVEESGAKAILVTRYLGTDTKDHYRPPQRATVYADPYYSRYHRYYPMAYREVYSPGYTVSVTTVSLEANLYDVETEKLVWSVRSESINPKMTKKYVDELVTIFTKDLVKNNLM